MSNPYVKQNRKHKLSIRMNQLGIRENDIEEKFILGSGRGGQKINKTASCVYLKHIPSGIEIKCRRSRGRELNRYYARCELCERIAERINGEKSRRQREIEKIRRQKKRRTRRQKERMLHDKKMQTRKKILRGRISDIDSEL